MMEPSPPTRLRPPPGAKRKAPRYRRAADVLRQRLRDGQWGPGHKLPALRELAGELKVSTKTIRRAIRILEGEGSLYNVPDIGAFVHPSYPGKTATRVTIALATINIAGAFETGIASGVEQACQDRHWRLQLYDARSNAELEARNLMRLADSGTRGAIIVPISHQANLETLVRLKLSGYAMVLVDRAVPGLLVDVVESNHEEIAFQATEYLLKNGHANVFMVAFPPIATSIEARIRGFERALLSHGIEPTRRMMAWADPLVSDRGVQQGTRWLEGYTATLPLLKANRPPIGIFALNDYVASGVYQACRELRLRIPDDVSIICVDDSDITRALHPQTTVVAQRTGEIARKAVELLDRRLQSETPDLPPQHITIAGDLIERDSVARVGPPL